MAIFEEIGGLVQNPSTYRECHGDDKPATHPLLLPGGVGRETVLGSAQEESEVVTAYRLQRDELVRDQSAVVFAGQMREHYSDLTQPPKISALVNSRGARRRP